MPAESDHGRRTRFDHRTQTGALGEKKRASEQRLVLAQRRRLLGCSIFNAACEALKRLPSELQSDFPLHSAFHLKVLDFFSRLRLPLSSSSFASNVIYCQEDCISFPGEHRATNIYIHIYI